MEQGTPEWLKMRKRFITSSDAAVIMEKNPWQTPYGLWREKNDLEPVKLETEAMRIGTEMEPIAREMFIKETGINVRPKVEFNGIFMASLDGYCPKERIVLEIKCGQKAFEKAEVGIIPEYYWCQIQHQLITTSCERAFYFAFWDFRFATIEVKRDENFIGDYIPKAREFYDYLVKWIEPPRTKRDYIQRDSLEWQLAAQEYLMAKERVKSAELQEKEAKEALIALSEGKSSQGSGVTLSKITRQGSVDYSIVPELKDVDLNKYRKKGSEYWSIYLDKEK